MEPIALKKISDIVEHLKIIIDGITPKINYIYDKFQSGTPVLGANKAKTVKNKRPKKEYKDGEPKQPPNGYLRFMKHEHNRIMLDCMEKYPGRFRTEYDPDKKTTKVIKIETFKIKDPKKPGQTVDWTSKKEKSMRWAEHKKTKSSIYNKYHNQYVDEKAKYKIAKENWLKTYENSKKANMDFKDMSLANKKISTQGIETTRDVQKKLESLEGL